MSRHLVLAAVLGACLTTPVQAIETEQSLRSYLDYMHRQDPENFPAIVGVHSSSNPRFLSITIAEGEEYGEEFIRQLCVIHDWHFWLLPLFISQRSTPDLFRPDCEPHHMPKP